MTDPNEEVVRAFLEMKGFFVRTNVRYYVKEDGKPGGNSDVDIVAINPVAKAASEELPFELEAEHFEFLPFLALEVKGWHSETIKPSTFKSHRRIFNFTRQKASEEVIRLLGCSDYRVVLVISSFTNVTKKKAETIKLLKDAGVHHVLEFSVIIKALQKLEENLNQDSLVMHSFRLAKIYGGSSK